MSQLLNITTIPVKIELVVDHAQLKYKSDPPTVQVSREKGGAQINSEPIKVQIDSFEMRQSIGLKSISRVIREASSKGIAAAKQATADYCRMGNNYANAHSVPIGKFIAARNNSIPQTGLGFLPEARPEISWSGGTVEMKFQSDKLNMDWNVSNNLNFEYTPGKVKLEILQNPAVEIQYVGGPIYVPPSADPSYVGSEINVTA